MNLQWVALLSGLSVAMAAPQNSNDNSVFDFGSIFGSYEEPPYAKGKDFDDFEERTYTGGFKWACTKRNSKDEDGMFMTLFRYITGQNEGGDKIDMTIPVSSSLLGQEREMCFFIPSDHQTSPPMPTNEEVYIKTRPEMTVYTRRVGGYMNDAKWQTELEDLRELVRSSGLGFTDEFYMNGYDSPIKFFGRRNEVWIVKE